MITNTHKAFGWVLSHCIVNTGEQFKLISKRETPLNRLSARTIYTKGRITGVHTNNPSIKSLDRNAGFCTNDLPNPLPALDLTMTAEEPSEWWCISLPSNKTLPEVTFLKLNTGESYSFADGSLVLICEGEVTDGTTTYTGPKTVDPSGAKTLTAVKDTYGIIFNKRFEPI
jgi:hypothetical protein